MSFGLSHPAKPSRERESWIKKIIHLTKTFKLEGELLWIRLLTNHHLRPWSTIIDIFSPSLPPQPLQLSLSTHGCESVAEEAGGTGAAEQSNKVSIGADEMWWTSNSNLHLNPCYSSLLGFLGTLEQSVVECFITAGRVRCGGLFTESVSNTGYQCGWINLEGYFPMGFVNRSNLRKCTNRTLLSLSSAEIKFKFSRRNWE